MIILKWIKSLTIFLLTGDKFIPEIHLKQPGFTSSACGPFTKHRERIQKFRETSNLKYLYRNELYKAVLIMMHIFDGYQRALASMEYDFFYIRKQYQ